MASNKTIKQDIVRDYLKKFPEASYASLARKIYKENETSFINTETIRSMIRYIVGSSGANNKSVKDKSMFKPNRPSYY